ncbi:mucin-15 [Python bivittatus]|uniref:Mucin-15 n=1 Tax=Python bivittatus TaxID=176946 RepID=A0A9F3QU70_PYTBI|nr:mucin-15 [Python bivittatus]
MRTTEGTLFILLLISLQWARNHSEDAVDPTPSRNSVNSTPVNPTTFSVASGRTSAIIFTAPKDISDSPNKSTVTESNAPSNSTTPSSSLHSLLLSTTHPLTFTTEDGKHSLTSSNRIAPSGMPTTTSGKYEATTYITSSETESNSVTTTTHNISFTTMVSHNTTQINGIAFHPTKNLSNITTMLLTTKSSGVMTAPTTNLPLKATDGSADARETPKANPSKGAVIFGTIVGAMFGSALIGLAGYFICGKRKPESFGHQRLYDDTRNDPVLRLDTMPEPFSPNFGDLSYYNPMAADENAAQNQKETSYNTIPMDDLTSSQPSA